MCNFISAIKDGNEYFYLTKDDLKGKRIKEFKEYNGNFWQEEICGHGAINFFYPEVKGERWECEDFSSLKNFPSCVVEDIKKGNFRGIGICIDILNNEGKKKYEKAQQPAWAEYNKVEQPALAEYNKVEQSAWAEYNKVEQSAWAEYEKITQSAWAEYEKITQPAWAEYEKIQQPAWAEYEKITQSAWAEQEKITQSAWAEYEKITQSAWAEYEKITQSAFWNIATQRKFRNKNWK